MIAFLFPGQGSQAPGMGEPWVDEPSWSVVDSASVISGRDVADLLLNADSETLTETRNAQLATFVTSIMVHHALTHEGGITPDRMAGHSLGEYSALCAAGAIELDDAVRLVTERGEAMQDAAGGKVGTMAAVLGLDDAAVAGACTRAGGEVWVANRNAPGQVVIAGDPAAIDVAAGLARELGAKRTMPLQVGGAFHTPFMAPARHRLTTALAEIEFADPDPVVLANVDAAPHPHGADWPRLLGEQLCSPVRWRETVEQMVADGVDTFVEVGPGAVLTGTVKRIDRGADRISIATPADLADSFAGSGQ